MYLVLIAWLYVTLLMAVAEATSPAGSVMGAGDHLHAVWPAAHGHRGLASWRTRAQARHHARAMAERAAQADATPRQPSQMQAAMRPLPPRAPLSRRCEKNRDGCDTVHQPGLLSLPYTCAMPSALQTLARQPARLAKLAWCVFTEILRCSSIGAQKASTPRGPPQSLRADVSAQPGQCLTGDAGRY